MTSEKDQAHIANLEKELSNKDKIIEELKQMIESVPKTPKSPMPLKSTYTIDTTEHEQHENLDEAGHLAKCKCVENYEKLKSEKSGNKGKNKPSLFNVSHLIYTA